MSTRKPSTTADTSTGAAVVSLPVSEAPEGVSAEELAVAKQRAEERDLNGWVNWLARPEKKIAIIGFTGSRDEAWDNPDLAGYERWLCNNLHSHVRPDQPWDRLYDLHDYKTISSDKPHEAFLRQTDKPVVVWNPRPEWPSSVAFPKDQAIESFGTYWNNSISWMVAAALLEGATHLAIVGVDMAQGGDNAGNGEYAKQRPSCEWMIGVAQGRGVKIYIPQTSDLMKVSAMYGLQDDSALYAKLAAREKELAARQAQLQNQLNQGQIQLAQLLGALENTRYFRDVWVNPRGQREKVDEQPQP